MPTIPRSQTSWWALLAALLLTAGPAAGAAATEWEKVFDRSAAFPDTAAGGGRARTSAITDGPHAFFANGRKMSLKWSTETAGRNPDFRIEVEQLIKLGNGGTRWQRVITLGRTHATGKESASLDTSPGNFRISILGHSMKYNLTVESPKQ